MDSRTEIRYEMQQIAAANFLNIGKGDSGGHNEEMIKSFTPGFFSS